MGIFRQFPYTNFHEMNMDWLLAKFKELADEWLSYSANWEKWKTDTDTAFQELKDYVLNYFDNENVKIEIIKYMDDLKDSGYFDDVIASMAIRVNTVNANLVFQCFNDYNTTPHLLDGMAYIDNNMIAIYHSSYSDMGKITIINATTFEIISELTGELFHGNSLTYKDGYLYVCTAFSQTSPTVLIPDIITVDVTDPYDPRIVSTIQPPLPSYSTGIYSLAYDPVTDAFYAICARGETTGEFNRLIIYENDLSAITGEMILKDAQPVSNQGVQLVYNGIAYIAYYDLNYVGYYAFDITNGNLINVFRMPKYINNYRFVGELESICYDWDSDRWFGGSRLTSNGVRYKTLSSIFELGITKNIPVVDISVGSLSDREKLVDIGVVQGENVVTTSIHRMTCVQDAIAICRNLNLFGVIRLAGQDLTMASLEIVGFKGVITGNSNNPIEAMSGILILGSDIRFTYCNFTGSIENPISNAVGSIAGVESRIYLTGCTSDKQVAMCDGIVTGNTPFPIHGVRSIILGSVPTGSTTIACYSCPLIS